MVIARIFKGVLFVIEKSSTLYICWSKRARIFEVRFAQIVFGIEYILKSEGGLSNTHMFLSHSNFTMYNTDTDTVTVLSGTNGNNKEEGTNGIDIAWSLIDHMEYYTARNATDVSQFVDFTGFIKLHQLVC